MKLKRIKKFWVAALAMGIMLPSMAFGAGVSINLKDAQGSPFSDLAGITVRILDGVGTVVAEQTAPSSSTVEFSNLSSVESYTIVTKYHKDINVDQNGTVGVDVSSTKSLRFASDTEILQKDFFINDPVASNVLVRVSRIPADWTGVKVKLTPVESSRLQISATDLIFNLTPSNGSAELTVPAMPYARYNWQVSDSNDQNVTIGSTVKSARNNATLSFNLEAAKPQVVNFTFGLNNPDRTAGTFSGETITVDIKDAQGTSVWNGQVTASGSEATLSSAVLANGTYTIEASMCKSGVEVCRSTTRTILLSGTPRNSRINFVSLSPVNLTMLLRDSRTSQGLNGEIKVYASDGTTLLDTVSVAGGSASRQFIYGYPYKIEASATGYSSRTMNLYPRQDQVREINLFAQ